jgi:dTDP-glucose pyrophosphorylase
VKDVAELFILSTSTIRHAIEVINRGAAQIALVVDGESRLVATLTDGDVRRALIRGESLDSPVDRVMNRSFRALADATTESEALTCMRREMLHQVPALDRDGRVTHLFLLEDLLNRGFLPNTVVLMAGGEGKRLRPLTNDRPKPMLQIRGKPLLEIILEQCIDAGFKNFYISVHYLKNVIKNHFGDGEKWGVNIDYLEEDEPLGTAGSLSLLPKRPTAPILVMNGDILTRVDFSGMLRFHSEYGAAATLGVREHLTEIPYGVGYADDAYVRGLEEKPIINHNVTAGIYVINPEAMDFIPDNQFFDMPNLVERFIRNDLPVAAFPIHEYWLDVGHPETIVQAEEDWS